MSRHAATRHEDSCSLACGPHAAGTTCATYTGRHRLPTLHERLMTVLALGERP